MFHIGFLREITEEFLGALRYVKKIPRDVNTHVYFFIVKLPGLTPSVFSMVSDECSCVRARNGDYVREYDGEPGD